MGRRNIRPPLAGGGPARSGELFRRGPFSDGLDHICGEKCRPTRAMGGESSRPPRLGAEPPPAGGRPASSGELLRRRPARTVRTIFAGKKRRPARDTGGESSRPPRLAAVPPPAGGRPASSGDLLRRRPARTVRTIFAGKKRRPARDTGGESSRPPRLAAVPPPADGSGRVGQLSRCLCTEPDLLGTLSCLCLSRLAPLAPWVEGVQAQSFLVVPRTAAKVSRLS